MDWEKSHTNLCQGSIGMQWREAPATVEMTALETFPLMPASYGNSTSPKAAGEVKSSWKMSSELIHGTSGHSVGIVSI
jgi:hypothetical protein